MNAERIRIESEDRGFVLIIEADDGNTHWFNIHGIAEEVYDTVKREIGPWLQERDEASRDFRERVSRYVTDTDEGPWPGESAMDYFQRTGDANLIWDQADTIVKAAKENA